MRKEVVSITQTMSFGPAMSALNAKQRSFVIALFNAGGKNAAEAYRAAGYESGEYAKTNAYHLLRNPKVQEAMREEARNRETADLPMTQALLNEIARTPGAQQLAAVKMKLHHAGLVEAKSVDVNMNVTVQTFEQKMDELKRLAAVTGDDPAELLKGITIDAEFDEVHEVTSDQLIEDQREDVTDQQQPDDDLPEVW